MRLKHLFKEQKDFQKHFFDSENISEEERVKFTKEFILSIHRELGEILDTIPWKLHRKEDKKKSPHDTVEEIIDCFKFLLNLCIVWGIDEDIFYREFFRKSGVVKQRYNQEILQVITKNDKVCAIDLDDTLADSTKYFVDVYNRVYNQPVIRSLEEFGVTIIKDKTVLKKTLSTLEYEEYKYWYRESGEKLNIPVMPGAKDLCERLRREGYKIVIISARPYEKHNRIFSDTLQWLDNNHIVYDAIYFEKDKHIKILKQLPNLSFIIEDNPLYAKQVAEQGYKVYLLSNETEDESEKNLRESISDSANIIKINNLFDIWNQTSKTN